MMEGKGSSLGCVAAIVGLAAWEVLVFYAYSYLWLLERSPRWRESAWIDVGALCCLAVGLIPIVTSIAICRKRHRGDASAEKSD